MSVRARGVTMVEVVSVVVVVGILAALAVPRFLATSGRTQLDADANRLALDLQQARSLSAKCRCRVQVVLHPGNGAWTVHRAVQGSGASDPVTDPVVRRDSLGTSVRFGFGPNFAALPPPPPGVDEFAASEVPARGLAAGADSDPCVDGGGSGRGSWDSVVVFCGSRGVASVETGALYLSTTRSSSLVKAILYNDLDGKGSHRIQRWTWDGAWRRS